MKTREELEAEVVRLVGEITPQLTAHGIDSSYLDSYVKKLDKTTGRQIRLLITWLIKLKNQLKEYQRIRSLLPESTWAMYELHGDCDDFREVVLLRKAKLQIRELCAGRPKFRKGDSNGYA